MRLLFVVCLGAAIFTSAGIAARPNNTRAAAFNPRVGVWISDDAPSSHPDITITIDVAAGSLPFKIETLMPAGGSTYPEGTLPFHLQVGWLSGFIGIPGPDGVCGQRYTFNDVPLAIDDPDPASFPAFLRDLAPGSHRARYTAVVGGVPINFFIDDVTVAGEPRLLATTFLGDPTHPFPNCAPFRGRIIILGHQRGPVYTPPLLTAPPAAGPRAFEFTITSRGGEVATRNVAATVQQGLQPRIESGTIAWSPVPGTSSQRLAGKAFYGTTCPLVRRLVIREVDRDFAKGLATAETSASLPAAPGPDYELAQVWADVIAYDADGVLLARDQLNYLRDFKTCWYPPGEEPLLHVSPAAGSCTGDVTFTGERFPAGVDVEVTMARFNDVDGGPRVAVAPVAADGTFMVKATLSEAACTYASMSGDNTMSFFAFNADEPHAGTIFAGVNYTASIPPAGPPPSVIGPVTGAGPAAHHEQWLLVALLAIAGAVLLGAGTVVRRS